MAMKQRIRPSEPPLAATSLHAPIQPVILIDPAQVPPAGNASVRKSWSRRGKLRAFTVFAALCGVIGLYYVWVSARHSAALDQTAENFTTDFMMKSGTVLSCCYEGWAGMAFTTGPSPITVTELGRWMLPGNSRDHDLKIVEAETKHDVPGSTARLSLGGLTPQRFHFARLAKPLTLEPNTRYYLLSSEQALNPSQDAFYGHDTIITTSGAAMLKKPVYWKADNWVELDTQSASYGPVTLRYVRGRVN
jgi:hypothetical protein